MKRLILLTIIAMLVAATSASACKIKALAAVKAIKECSVLVVTPPNLSAVVDLAPVMAPVMAELSEIVELTPVLPKVAEIKAFVVNAKTPTLQATVAVEDREERSSSVVVTVIKALGKALLKGIATLIHRAV